MTNRLLSPATWARDLGFLGLATGSMAPFFVIFDPGFALGAGLAGGASGVVLGGALGWTVDRLRGTVPLAVMVPAAAAIGSLWGAFAGVWGGVFSSISWLSGDTVPLGFIVGAVTGMVALGLFFLPYLMVSARGGPTAPLVGLAALGTPLLGWMGLAALAGSTFGLWLFALPVFLWLGVLLDRSERGVRSARAARTMLPTWDASTDGFATSAPVAVGSGMRGSRSTAPAKTLHASSAEG